MLELRGIPFRKSLLFQLLALMIAVALAPLLISGYSLVRINERFLEDEVLMLHTKTARDTAGQIDSYIKRTISELKIVARSQEPFSGISEADRRRFLAFYLEQYRELRALSILTPSGAVKLRIFQPDGPSGSAADVYTVPVEGPRRKGIETALTGAIHVSEPAITGTPPLPLVDIYLPIYGPSGVQEILRGRVSAREVVKEVMQVRFRREGSAFLVDTSGRLMAHPDQTRVSAQENMKSVDVVGRYLAVGKTGGATPFKDKDGREMLGAYSAVPSVGWGVVVQEPRSDAFMTVREMKQRTLFWGVVALVLAAGSSAVFARRVSGPVRALVDSSLTIAKGDFKSRVEVTSESETGRLAETFNYMAEQLALYDRNMRELYLSTIRSLAEAIDAKDPYTRGHSERVSRLSVSIARAMGMKDEDVEVITIAALLHDIGKIGIKDNILGKTSDLTPQEYEIMKSHPVIGAGIMSHIKQLERVLPGMRHHHETMDGTGYPDGLDGAKIPIAARIIGLSDTYDAMTTDRPYQKAMASEEAVEKIKTLAGPKFDPSVVDAFLKVMVLKRRSA